MKKIAILGSTGSIGTQTLDIVRQNADKLKAVSLVAFSDDSKLAAQAKEFAPEYTALIARDGKDCLVSAVQNCDVAVVATRGTVAIDAVLYCLKNGIDVALANKETLVCAGELIMQKAGKAKLIPVDSEHCAISQCLSGRKRSDVDKILLTASGGPFADAPVEELSRVTAQDALKHPNWHMGSKICVDSATMMNKALEVIEASFLFSVPVTNIQIVLHQQSVVHSMVQFADGEVVAQLAMPDMRLPIQIALLGESGSYSCDKINFADFLQLTFDKPNFAKFPCAEWGYKIMRYPPLCRTVMNSANDVCVESFLQGKFSFVRFDSIIQNAVDAFGQRAQNVELSVENIRRFEAETKTYVKRLLDGELC